MPWLGFVSRIKPVYTYYNTWNWERGTYDVNHLHILTCEGTVSRHLAVSGLTVRLPVWPWQQVCVKPVRKWGVRATWIFIMTSPVYWLQCGGHTQVRLFGPTESTVNWPGRRREEGGFELIAHIRVIQVLPVADNWIDEAVSRVSSVTAVMYMTWILCENTIQTLLIFHVILENTALDVSSHIALNEHHLHIYLGRIVGCISNPCPSRTLYYILTPVMLKSVRRWGIVQNES